MTEMMIQTSDKGLQPVRTHSLTSTDSKEVVAFLKRGNTTAGFSIQYAVRGREVVQVMKKGKLCQRDVKPLIEAGFTGWLFSWCWAPKNFRLVSGEVVPLAGKVDLVKNEDVRPWARAFGYA